MRSTLRRKLRRWRRSGARPAWMPGVAVSARMAAVAATLALAAPAPAAPSWGPPRELSSADSAPLNLGATAGLSPTGDGVVLWHAQKGVESAVRAPGHNCGSPRTIACSTLSMPDLRPQLAFDAKGAALA